MDEGMEALLDFEEFGQDVPALTVVESPVQPDKPAPAQAPDIPDSPASPEAPQSEPPKPNADVTEATSNVKADPPGDTQPKKKRKPQPGLTGTIPKKMKSQKEKPDDGPSTSSQEASQEEEDLDDLLDDGDDFEGDILDLVPLKEEDPEDVAERQKLQLLISHLSEEQLNRYEVYRRASFPKASVRRVVQTVGGCTVSQNAVIAMAGIAKMHVGEIVEAALDVKTEWKETGPVQPKHLREAARRLRNKSAGPSKYRKKTQTQPYP